MKILIVGAGPMAIEYAKVLDAQNKEYIVVGNSKKGVSNFEETINKKVILGGVKKWINDNPNENYKSYKVIVAVNENLLGIVTRDLIEVGFNKILVEKPGGLDFKDIEDVNDLAISKRAEIYVGYNRRFLASTIKLQELIELDGGINSFNFEFTEWGHIIKTLIKGEGVLQAWFIQNSSHVIDLAFFIGGKPKIISGFISGGEKWHSKATVFAGAGISEKDAIFSYNANWESAGRWWVEFLTKNNRYIMKPMEKLFVQKRGSIDVEEIDIDNNLDQLFKPGLFQQVLFFLNNPEKLMTIKEQVNMLPIYLKMISP